MDDLIDKIDSIEKATTRLWEVHSQLRKENSVLKTELLSWQQKVSQLQEQLESSLTDNQNLKTANALLGSNDFKRETKLKINSLIREIDLCIDQLSK